MSRKKNKRNRQLGVMRRLRKRLPEVMNKLIDAQHVGMKERTAHWLSQAARINAEIATLEKRTGVEVYAT